MKKNFLKPFALICLSLVIMTIVVANVVLERPSPPREPNVNYITATSCEISYKNSPGWIQKGVSKELKYTVINMKENSTTRFRIKAINRVGESDPVETGIIEFKY